MVNTSDSLSIWQEQMFDKQEGGIVTTQWTVEDTTKTSVNSLVEPVEWKWLKVGSVIWLWRGRRRVERIVKEVERYWEKFQQVILIHPSEKLIEQEIEKKRSLMEIEGKDDYYEESEIHDWEWNEETIFFNKNTLKPLRVWYYYISKIKEKEYKLWDVDYDLAFCENEIPVKVFLLNSESWEALKNEDSTIVEWTSDWFEEIFKPTTHNLESNINFIRG